MKINVVEKLREVVNVGDFLYYKSSNTLYRIIRVDDVIRVLDMRTSKVVGNPFNTIGEVLKEFNIAEIIKSSEATLNLGGN